MHRRAKAQVGSWKLPSVEASSGSGPGKAHNPPGEGSCFLKNPHRGSWERRIYSRMGLKADLASAKGFTLMALGTEVAVEFAAKRL